ncbi:MAG: lysostaphin resistance A-like protein [Acidithiobacillales bacterium]
MRSSLDWSIDGFMARTGRLALFALLTLVGFLVFALTITFAPVLSPWMSYASRAALLAVFGGLWWFATRERRLSRLRGVFFAFFAALLGLSLGFFLGDWGLVLCGLTTQTPAGIAVAKFSQALLTVVGVLVAARLCGEDLESLYVRKGRLLLGLGVGLLAAAACGMLSLQQFDVRSLGADRLRSLAPWILLFVASNGFMEELVFRGLFLGRFGALFGPGLAVLSTSVIFTLAHTQVRYAPDMLMFLVITFALSLAWGWLMQKTGSLWGSALFHAGADLLIILPIFRGLGAV